VVADHQGRRHKGRVTSHQPVLNDRSGSRLCKNSYRENVWKIQFSGMASNYTRTAKADAPTLPGTLLWHRRGYRPPRRSGRATARAAPASQFVMIGAGGPPQPASTRRAGLGSKENCHWGQCFPLPAGHDRRVRVLRLEPVARSTNRIARAASPWTAMNSRLFIQSPRGRCLRTRPAAKAHDRG
jgi:hypothetical protein